MSSEIITGILASLGGGVAFWGAVKAGLIKVQIGENKNGELKAIKEELAGIQANHLEHIEVKLDKLIELSQETVIIVRQLQK